MIPHNHFRVMLRDDSFLKAGLQAASVLHSKRRQAEAAGEAADLPGEILDELEDEVGANTHRGSRTKWDELIASSASK